MGSVRRSFVFLIIQNYYAVALQLVGTMIISRILTPDEIGTYAIAAVLGALAGQLRDFGLQEYLIQEKDLTHAKIRSAFGMNVITSWSMAVLFFVGSTYVGEFYREPGVAEVMRIQSISFLIIPFGAINMAYFRRELNYKPHLIAGLFSNTTSFSVAILLVLNGFSYLSMAWSAFAGVLVGVSISLTFRPKDYPRLPSFTGLGRVFHFSKHAMSIYVLGQINKGAPEAIIGRIQDATAVAFFSRAYGMIEIFNRMIIGPSIELCLPYLAKAGRAGHKTSYGYLKAVTLLTGIGWPFFVIAGILAYSGIRILYGPQWHESVPLAQLLCATAIVELLYWLAAEAMIAEGRIDQSNRLKFILLFLRLLGIFLIIPFGLAGVCWGLLSAALIGAGVSQYYLHNIIGLRFSDVIKAVMPSIFTTLFACLPAALIVSVADQHEGNYLGVFLGAGGLSVAAWIIGARFFKHPIWDEIILIIQKIIERRNKTSTRTLSQVCIDAFRIRDSLLVSYRRFSRVFRCTSDNRQLAVKVCIGANGQPDHSIAKLEYASLQRLAAQVRTMGGIRLCPDATGIVEEEATFAMSWEQGRELTGLLLSRATSVREGLELGRAAGNWLKVFHRLGMNSAFSNDLPEKVLFCKKAITALHNPPHFMTDCLRKLEATALSVGKIQLPVSWALGDFKSDNLIVDNKQAVGIDIHIIEQDAVTYNVAQFLVHLELLCWTPRGLLQRPVLEAVAQGFLNAYLPDRTDWQLPIVWLRTIMLLQRAIDAATQTGLKARIRRHIVLRALAHSSKDLDPYLQAATRVPR